MSHRILLLTFLAIAAIATLWVVCSRERGAIADRGAASQPTTTKHSDIKPLRAEAVPEPETASNLKISSEKADTTSSGEEESSEWEADGKILVRGRVTDQDGKPVVDQEIWLVRRTQGEMIRATPSYLCEEDIKERGAKARTNAQGGFELDGIRAGKWWIGVAPVAGDGVKSGRGDVAPIATQFEVEEEEAERVVEVKTHRGLAIQGKVLLPDGKPAPGCQVVAQIDRSFTFASTATDDMGTFALSALAPGEVWLQASRKGLLADSEPTLVNAGDADVALRLKEAGAISGSIVDRETRKIAPALLFLTHRDAERGCTQLAGSRGELHLDRLEPGVYDLVASSGDGKIGVARGIVVKSDAEVRDVAIEIAPGARLKLEYGGTDAGGSFQLFSQEACLGWVSLQPKQTVTQVVPPGAVRIVEMRAEGGVERVVEVEVGKEQTVVLGKE
jgi:hypothetical protein